MNLKRGTVWFQEGDGDINMAYDKSRVRIILPDGKSTWLPMEEFHPKFNDFTESCWNKCYQGQRSANSKEAVALMRKYDKRLGYKPAKFIGYV